MNEEILKSKIEKLQIKLNKTLQKNNGSSENILKLINELNNIINDFNYLNKEKNLSSDYTYSKIINV